MSFHITCFSELVKQYPTWAELRTFLTSSAGGKLRVIAEPESPYAIVRYTKGVSDFKLPHVGAFRSVVWNTDTNRPVSVAPIKAEHNDPPTDVHLHVTDFVDGTMIQGFRPTADVSSRIATRTSMDARGTFYTTRSFAELFGDATRVVGGTEKFLDSVLSGGDFVSLVLQHPDHKTVMPIAQPRMYVTYYGSVNADGLVEMSAVSSNWPDRLVAYAPQLHESGLTFSERTHGQKMLRDLNTNYTWQGLVFQDMTSGRRWRLRNPAYVAVRALRGSEAKSVERYVRLRAQGQVKNYLGYFREENALMWAHEQKLRNVTQQLYNAYNAVNKLKTHTFKDFQVALRPHMYALHGKFLSTLPKKDAEPVLREDSPVKPVLKQTVVAYVNQLSTADQLNLLENVKDDPAAVLQPARFQ